MGLDVLSACLSPEILIYISYIYRVTNKADFLSQTHPLKIAFIQEIGELSWLYSGKTMSGT